MIGQTIGSYVLESKLGEGGMGEVFLGRHRSLETLAAVKVMSPAFSHDPRLHERFSREAKTQAQLRHPNIAQVLDHVEHEGRWFLVVEYMPNGTLEDVLKERRQPIPSDEALAWSRQALLGLDYAHQNGIVHRDVKPANLLINGRGEAAVTDFGIALEAGARRLTQTGVSIGTPEYMSPEQIRGAADLDHRTDIYSMGIVVYELLAGQVPFHAESIFEVQRAQVSDPPPLLRSVAPHVPESLDALVMRALAKEPKDRYASCGDFAAAIDAYQKSDTAPTPSTPPPRPHRRTVLESAAPPPISPPSDLSSTHPTPPRTLVNSAPSPVTPSAPVPAPPVPPAGPKPKHRTVALGPGTGPPGVGTGTGTVPPPPVTPKKPLARWGVATALVLALVAVGGLFLGEGPGEEPSSDDAAASASSEMTDRVEEIEQIELEALGAAGAAEAALATALTEAASTAEKSAAAATAAAASSCALAQNHAKVSGEHAGRCQAAATEADSEAAKAEDAARRAASAAAELENVEEARGTSRWLEAIAGIAYAALNDSALRRRGLESSERADEAARKARGAGETAAAAAGDAEEAAIQAKSAAESCRQKPRHTAPPPTDSASQSPAPTTTDSATRPTVPPPTDSATRIPRREPPVVAALPAKPVVAVLAVGDPVLTASLEATLEERLGRGGFDVRDELNSLELAALIDKKGNDISMSEILPILVREGFHVAVIVKVEEGMRKEIYIRGQSLHTVIARLRLNAQLLPARRSIGRGWSERVEYTELNADVKGKRALISATAELVPAIRQDWSSLRGGG